MHTVLASLILAVTAGTASALPPSFEQNRGQAPEEILFLSRARGLHLGVTREGMILGGAPGGAGDFSRLRFVGGAPLAPRGEAPLERRSHYLLGNDPAFWVRDVPHFARLVAPAVYPGIDLVLHAGEGSLEFDLVAQPGSDPGCIVLAWDGVDGAQVDSAGDLVARTPVGELRLLAPRIYQGDRTTGRPVEGSFVLEAGGMLRFQIGEHDRNTALVIDPILVFATHLGTQENEALSGVAVDRMGAAYVTGFTSSPDFPTRGDPFQPRAGQPGEVTAFVAKLLPTGRDVVWSTYLGGHGRSNGQSIVLDASGNVLVAGTTDAPDFPVRSATQKLPGGGADAFLTALRPSGEDLVVSTYLGGSGDENTLGMARNKGGQIYLAGSTTSANFPTVSAFATTRAGPRDAFVAAWKASLGALAYSTYLGGMNEEIAYGIAANTAGEAFVVGQTTSKDFPVKSPLLPTLRGPSDGFVARLASNGRSLVYATYLGGTGADEANAIAVDADDFAFVAGQGSQGFPLEGSIYPPVGDTLLYLTKLEPSGSATAFSTLLAQNVFARADALQVNEAGEAHVVGAVTIPGAGTFEFPTRGPALQRDYGGGTADGYLLRVDASGTFFRYASFLGGPGGDEARCLALGEGLDVYVGGITTGEPGIPTTQGAFQRNTGGNAEAFLARVDTEQYPDDPPYLTVARDQAVLLNAATAERRFRVIAPPGLRAVITATDADARDANVLYARYGGEAFPYRFDHAAEERGRSSQRLVIPETQAGELYLRIQATVLGGGGNAVTLRVELQDFVIAAFSPQRIAAGARFHAAVDGAGFRSDAVFTLANQAGGPTLNAVETIVTSPTHAEVIFDLAGQPPGTYRVKGFNPNDGSSGLENALQVVPAGTPGIVDVQLSAPDTVRFDRPARVTLTYENVGDEELPAPLFRLRAPATVGLRLESDSSSRGSTLDLLGANPHGPSGILSPGARGSIAVVFQPRQQSTFQLTVEQLLATDADSLNWATTSPPPGFPAQEWSALRARLPEVLGTTWETYAASLGVLSTRLARRGVGGPALVDATELFRRAALRARAVTPEGAASGRLLRSPNNAPLGGVTITAFESGVARSTATTGPGGSFVLECLAPGRTYDLRSPTHDLGGAQVTLPASGDLLNVELRAIELTTAVASQPSECAVYVLPGAPLLPPASLLSPRHGVGITVVRSTDPNEKDGPEGEGPLRSISIGDELLYTIHFENIGQAPAQTVVVSDPLEPDLDWSTFRLLDVGVGLYVFSLDEVTGSAIVRREGYSASRTQSGIRTGTQYSGVEARCDFDPLTGLLSWTFQTIDPTTGLPAPPSATEGFLPPNTSPPAGEGWVSFSVFPRETLSDGTEIRNEGSITFDDPPSLATDPVTNTIAFSGLTLRAPRFPVPADTTTRTVLPLGLYFSWEADPRSEHFDVKLWRDGEAKPAQFQTVGLTAPRLVPQQGFQAGVVYHWQVRAWRGQASATGSEWSFRMTPAIDPPGGQFLRGEANSDGTRDISDASFILGYLFLGGTPPGCLDSADVNDDGTLDISDPVTLLGHLFTGTSPVLPAPFETCGGDPTPDNLGCNRDGC